MLPMGSRFAREGRPADGDLAFYRARAHGGVGLIITGASVIHPSGRTRSRNLYEPFTREALPFLARLCDEVHAEGAAIFGQLYHPGRMAAGDADWPTWGPSPLAPPGTGDAQIPHVMTKSEIEDVIDGFGTSASNLRSCGYDGL